MYWINFHAKNQYRAEIRDTHLFAMLQKYSEIKGDFGISKEMTPSPVPSSFGDLGGSIFSEVTGKGVEAITKQNGTGEKK